MVEIFAEVRRVMRDDGTLWLNLGDSYGQGGGTQVVQTKNASHGLAGYRHKTPNIKPKDLCGIPWRVAFALQADGWYLRSDIMWSKPNPMPESVTDRPTKAHEYLFLLTKKAKYYYDADAIREPHADTEYTRSRYVYKPSAGSARTDGLSCPTGIADKYFNRGDGKRNRRTVWEIATQPFTGAGYLADYVGADGKPYKVSEDCPIHGPRHDSEKKQRVECDEQLNQTQTDKSDTASRLGQEPISESASSPDHDSGQRLPSNDCEHISENISESKTADPSQKVEPQKNLDTDGTGEKLACNLDSDGPGNSQTAIFHSTQNRKTGLVSETSPSCISSDQTGDHTDDRSKQRKHSYSKDKTAKCTCQVISVDHFATFPEKLVEPCILAGSNDRACGICGAAWERAIEVPKYGDWHGRKGTIDELTKGQVGKPLPDDYYRKTLGFRPTCEHNNGDSRSIIFDPFMGSGTVALVALKLGRDYIGVELKPEYIEMAMKRLKPLGNRPLPQQEILL